MVSQESIDKYVESLFPERYDMTQLANQVIDDILRYDRQQRAAITERPA